ncbi:mandelate racemase/muconate lactonizing enzyme family protein [Neobacillus sp. GCM10023253]|uniref:mandelate racemase/muconate lactonizing enzyme family protein n=1 Tax=Neobacillus sp. GCM10023253 TaxID=3252644 RepID=UPI003615015F
MKIASIETFPLFYPLTQPYGDANGYKQYRTCFLFRITTQSGITGWGECVDWLPTLKLGFENRIIPHLIGKNALNRLQLVNHIKKWHQRAAAGVSMALTEIAAKHSGLSVCDLWGGRWREEVPVYASFQSYTDKVGWAKHSIHLVEQALDYGFTMIKVKIGGKTFKEDLMHILGVRNVMSENHQLILDANQSYDFSTAKQWGQPISEWNNFLWFEEPLPINLVSDYKLLRSSFPAPIAGGENLKNAKEFLAFLREGAIDIIQPDIAHEDGVDGFRHTLQLSRYFGVRASPHTFDGALSRLYAIFAQACLPAWSKMPLENIEPVEWDVMENPFNSIIPIEPGRGTAAIPTGEGIGVELDQGIIERYCWDGSMYS